MVIPLEYESIITSSWLGPDNVYHPNFRLAARKHGRWGFIAWGPDARFEGKYDHLILIRPTNASSRPFFSLKKDRAYGIALRASEGNLRFNPLRIEPQFPYAISEYFQPRGNFHYPYYLFKCINDKGEFMGYADHRGRMYFEN